MNEKQKAAFLQKYISDLCGDGSVCDRNLDRFKPKVCYQEVLLGDIIANKPPVAVCRHRSLLFKILGDEVGLKIELQRGDFVDSSGYGGHAWNHITFSDGTSAIFDAMHNITSSTYPHVDEYAQHYFTNEGQQLYVRK